MKNFIRLAEVWVPSEDGSLLELAGGLFENAPAFGSITASMCFGRAEGLPGRAWDDGHPVMIRKLEGSYFRRAAAAKAAGLSSAVAIPIFKGERLTCVVVLLLGDTASHYGAVELWHNDPAASPDLTLADGYFGSNHNVLEVLTRDSSLPRGTGAPGLAWKRQSSMFINDVSASKHFLRGPQAAAAGIVRAMAIPCSVRGSDTWVLNLLSSSRTPVANRIEVWKTSSMENHLFRAVGQCEVFDLAKATGEPVSWPVESLGAIGRAWKTGVAQAESVGAVRAWLTEDEAKSARLSSMLVMPVIVDEAVAEVVCLYF